MGPSLDLRTSILVITQNMTLWTKSELFEISFTSAHNYALFSFQLVSALCISVAVQFLTDLL